MKRRKKWLLYSVSVIVILIRIISIYLLNHKPEPESIHPNVTSNMTSYELYEGRPLSIAVIGEPPEVREMNVHFEKMTFDDLKNINNQPYDAVFITKENLSEAAESQYGDVYLQMKIPIFFMGSTKGDLPFFDKGLEYMDAPDIYNPSYATGILCNEDGERLTYSFELDNGEENFANIGDVYSRVFNTIEQNKDFKKTHK